MAVPGPKIAVAPVVLATAPRKTPAEAGDEVRVVRTQAVAAAAETATAPAPREDPQQLAARIAERLDQFLKDSGRDVEYRVDADAGATVITVRRSDTGEVVRQFPSEEALAWLKRLNEQSGTFVDALA